MSQGDLQQDGGRDRDQGLTGPGPPGRRTGCGTAMLGPFPDAGTKTQANAVCSRPHVAWWLDGTDGQAAGTMGGCFIPSRKPPGAVGSRGDASTRSVATKVDRQSHAGWTL